MKQYYSLDQQLEENSKCKSSEEAHVAHADSTHRLARELVSNLPYLANHSTPHTDLIILLIFVCSGFVL